MVKVQQRRGLQRRGVVLFVVTVVLAMVSLAAMGFLVSMKTENRAAHLQADQQQVHHVAASADAYLKAWSQLSRDEVTYWGGLTDNPSQFRDIIVDWQLGGSRHGRFSVLTADYEDGSADPLFRFGAASTSARLNLHKLLIWDEQSPGHGRTALMNLPGMTEEVADSILDWIDADDTKREFGAESEFYLGLDPPRQPPNRVPDRLAHLLAVRGVTHFRMWGSSRPGPQLVLREDEAGSGWNAQASGPRRSAGSMARPSSANAIAGGESWQIPAPPWCHYLTVHSAERIETSSGENKINVNENDLRRLHQRLTTAFDSRLADFVVTVRQYGRSDTDPKAVTDTEVPSVRFVKQAEYEFQSPLEIVNMVTAVPVEVGADSDEESIERFVSPFRTDRPSSLRKLVDWMDKTSAIAKNDDSKTPARKRVVGRIDVTTAPRRVLLSIPGCTPELVERIISEREQPSDETGSRNHAVWLLAEGLVDVPTMEQLLPNVTVAGNIITAQIVAYYDARSPWARHQIMIDGTRGKGLVVDFQDLSRLGHGFRYDDLLSPDSAMETTPSAESTGQSPVNGRRPDRFPTGRQLGGP